MSVCFATGQTALALYEGTVDHGPQYRSADKHIKKGIFKKSNAGWKGWLSFFADGFVHHGAHTGV